MSTVTGDSAAYHASVEVPDDGDERDAAALLVLAEAAMDNTAFLYERVVGGGETINVGDINADGNADIAGSAHVGGNLTVDGLLTAQNVNTGTVQASVLVTADNIASNSNVTAGVGFFVGSRSVTVWIDAPADSEDGWAFERTPTIPQVTYWRSTVTNIRWIKFSLNGHIFRPATITQVKARYRGASGHAALPDTMPELLLTRQRVDPAGAASNEWSAVDNAADVATYQADHTFTLSISGGGHTFDPSTGIYYVTVASESDSGANAIAGARLYAIGVTFSYTRVDRT
ncbi:hypothetical protein WME88_27480 [Sorangium sp. So ce216]